MTPAGFTRFIGSGYSLSQPGEPFDSTTQHLPLDIFAAFCGSVGFLWLWFLGAYLNEIVRSKVKRDATFFAVAFVISVVYAFVLFISAQNPEILKAILLTLSATLRTFVTSRGYRQNSQNNLGFPHNSSSVMGICAPHLWQALSRAGPL